jgi:hypothetical protein
MSHDKPVEFPPLLSGDEIDRMVVRKPQPPEARAEPYAVLLHAYPRIAERLRSLWGTGACDAYLADLLIDTRGNRQGFPPAVVSALLELSEIHRERTGATIADIEHLTDLNRRGAR